jgi:hypothetical protein
MRRPGVARIESRSIDLTAVTTFAARAEGYRTSGDGRHETKRCQLESHVA